MNGQKFAELNYGLLLVFTKARWLTAVASVSSEARENSRGLKMLLSQGRRPNVRKSLGAISPVAASLYAFSNSSPIRCTGFVAVVRSYGIILNGVYCDFVDLKNGATDSGVKPLALESERPSWFLTEICG